MTLLRHLSVALVAALLVAACGDDGGDGDGAEAVDATTAPSGDEPGDDDDADDDAPGPGGLCEALAVEDVAAAAGVALDSVGPQVSQMAGNDFEVAATGCSFEGEGDADVEVTLLDAEFDTNTTFAAMLAQSQASTFDDFPHEAIDGLGDGAFFEAGLRQEELVVRAAGTVLFVEGTGADDETLGRAELQAVAEVALAAMG